MIEYITTDSRERDIIKNINSKCSTLECVIPPNHGTSHPVVYENRSKKIIPLNLTVFGN